MPNRTIITAVEAVGSQIKLAEKLGVTAATVNQWVTGHRPVPAARCLSIEQATDGIVTRYQLRPDVFGPPQRRAVG